MYNLLIVDDESWIRKGIKAKLAYHQIAFNEIIEAENGKEALSILETFSADIVITDVKMPFVNGLDLFKTAKSKGYDPQFIFISGYADFSYVEQALNLGAKGYLLKPIKDSDFKDCFNKVFNSLQTASLFNEVLNRSKHLEAKQSFHTMEQDINQLFQASSNTTLKTFASISLEPNYILGLLSIDHYEKCDFPLSETLLSLLKTKIIEVSSLYYPNNLTIFEDYSNNYRIMFLFHGDTSYNLTVSLSKYFSKLIPTLNKDYNLSVSVGISELSPVLSPTLYTQAKEALLQKIINGYNQCYTYATIKLYPNFNYPSVYLNLLSTHLTNQASTHTSQLIDTIFTNDYIKNANYHHLKCLWFKIAKIALEIFNNLELSIDESYYFYLFSESKLEIQSNLKDLSHYISSTLISLMQKNYAIESNSTNITDQLKSYISTNFSMQITVKALADEFCLNPNYLSTLFKKETGSSIISYLKKIRIEHACHLLSETNYNISTISENVGYADVQYFYKIFKKHTGNTPLAYRTTFSNSTIAK